MIDFDHIGPFKDRNELLDFLDEHHVEIFEHYRAVKQDPKNLLKAMDLCSAVNDSSESRCDECPLNGLCDPCEFPEYLQTILRTVAPDHERSLEFCEILDLCLEEDEDVCRTACPYYDRCENEITWILFHDVYTFLKEVGAYDQSK